MPIDLTGWLPTQQGLVVYSFDRGDDGSPTSSGQIKHSTGPLTLGSDNRSGYYWRGKMDEFVLYHRALSEKEIWQLYKSGN